MKDFGVKVFAALLAVGTVAIALGINWGITYLVVKVIFNLFGVTAISPAVVATLIVVFVPVPNKSDKRR